MNDTENNQEGFGSVSEKSAEIVKSFIESSAKQFEVTMNASKAIFDTITKHYSEKESGSKEASETKEGIHQTITAANKWFTESSKIMMDMYGKQSKYIIESYNNFMDLAYKGLKTMNENNANTGSFHSGVELFLKNLEDASMISKKMFSSVLDTLNNEEDKSYVSEVLDMMLDTYSKQTGELAKFSKDLFDSADVEKVVDLNKELSEKLQKDMQKNFEASRKLISAITDSYVKETDFSPKAGKKMLDEIFAEIDVVTKNNIKFWNNWFNHAYYSKAAEKDSQTEN